ncbi:hypothetical protein [Novosphingobium sp. M1R2S20]|uniref:Uncharacterized protein n=1 Tax=Novosphingobium rhizovicinum TaxID=3228928 RepID=A0ABV3RCL2_9SPHN
MAAVALLCVMETYEVASHSHIEKLDQSLKSCLDELDQLDAAVAAAHLEAALHAFRRQFAVKAEPFKAE